MELECFVSGIYETNSYILRESSSSTDCIVIDTSLDEVGLADYLAENNYKPKSVILTHGHADHIAGLVEMKKRWPHLKVYISETDAAMLTDSSMNLSLLTGSVISVGPADVVVKAGDIIEETGIRLEVIETPGHTPGGICLYCTEEGLLFSGDTLFEGSVGRTDFPGGNAEEMIKSIKETLFPLGDETIVYPGHGPKTTIGKEKKYNPFLQAYEKPL